MSQDFVGMVRSLPALGLPGSMPICEAILVEGEGPWMTCRMLFVFLSGVELARPLWYTLGNAHT